MKSVSGLLNTEQIEYSTSLFDEEKIGSDLLTPEKKASACLGEKNENLLKDESLLDSKGKIKGSKRNRKMLSMRYAKRAFVKTLSLSASEEDQETLRSVELAQVAQQQRSYHRRNHTSSTSGVSHKTVNSSKSASEIPSGKRKADRKASKARAKELTRKAQAKRRAANMATRSNAPTTSITEISQSSPAVKYGRSKVKKGPAALIGSFIPALVACLVCLIVVAGVVGGTVAADEYERSQMDLSSLSLIEQQVALYLLDKGLDPIHAAGVMGNIYAESGFDPAIVEAPHAAAGDGFGLCQWSFSRRTQLFEYAKSQGKQANDLTIQLDFLWAEMTGEGPAAAYTNTQYEHSGMIATKNVKDATSYFLWKFERPNALYARFEIRLEAAERYYAAMSGGGGNIHLTPGALNHPCPTGTFTSPFGARWGTIHLGNDWGCPIGTPIYAAESGTVTGISTSGAWSGGAGNYVIIDHGNGLLTKYFHLSTANVLPGQTVQRGQQIAQSGNTGDSTGPHLHWEVHVNGTAVDGRNYL